MSARQILDKAFHFKRPKTSANLLPLLPVVLRDADLTTDPGAILYHERNPQSGVVLRHIPGHIEVDDDGRPTEGLFNPYNDLWIPVLCVPAWWCFMMDATGISSISGFADRV